MVNLKSQNNKNTLVWGNYTIIDILKKLYKGKKLATMSDAEVNQMLEDLI